MTVMSSSRLKNWKIMPTCRRRNRAAPVSLSLSTRSPPTRTVPLVGRSIPAMRLSSVDLPLPDGPMIATASPAAIDRLTSATAGAAAFVVLLGHVLELNQGIHAGTVGRCPAAAASAAMTNPRTVSG